MAAGEEPDRQKGIRSGPRPIPIGVSLKAPSPAFSCYPKDVLGDETCAAMTHEEFGCYWRLIFHAWLEGSIPSDHVRLARILKVNGRKFSAIWPAIEPCWEASPIEPETRLVQRRLEGERRKQHARSRVQSANGLLGGRPLKSTTGKSDGFPEENPTGKPKKARAPASSPSPYNNGLTSTEKETQGESVTLSAGTSDVALPIGVAIDSVEAGQTVAVELIRRRDPEAEVFAYWVEKTDRRNPVFTDERRRLLAARLSEESIANPTGDPVEGLKLAVDGALSDPLYNGSETGRKYLEFDNIFRNRGRDRIEKLQRLARAPERSGGGSSTKAGETDARVRQILADAVAARAKEGR